LAIIVTSKAPRGANRSRFREISPSGPAFPVLTIWDEPFRTAVQRAGQSTLKVSLKLAAGAAQRATLKNVIGVLPGSDPSLKDTYVLVTAHYDHLGVRPEGLGDRIFNGANDNASGSATLMEMANALAALPTRPRRSIAFIALFGEEVGEIGSAFYARHPVLPLDKTVADINLEQMGRTDGSDGPKVGQFNLTGFDFTTMAPTFRKAAEDAGVRAVKDDRRGDDYFARSDNAAFALAGVPSTTASVTYDFPDYHAVGDEWPKLDYDNMAKVDSAVALAIFRIADDAVAPEWNTSNPKTKPFAEMRQEQK
jgi:Zn-dependent M28 family amino/carboxypeptidase